MGNVITPYSPVPEVKPQVEPTPYQRLDVNPDAFGAGIGRALEKAGSEFMALGEKQATYTNELYANDASTQGMKALNGAWDEYGNYRGRAAHDNLPQFQNRVEQIYHDAVAGAPNDQARSYLSKSMRYMADRYLSNGQSHATNQMNQWRDQSTKDHATELANQAALAVNDPEKMKGFIEAGAQDWRTWAEEHALDPESTDGVIRKYKGGAYHSIIAERIATGDLNGAQKLFADHAEEMDAGNRVTVERLMNPAIKSAKKNAIIDHLLGGSADQAEAGGQPQPSIGDSIFISPEMETGQKDPLKGIRAVNTNDSGGTHSYGNVGLNSNGSAQQFVSRYGKQFGLTAEPGTAAFDRQWKNAAGADPVGLHAAEMEWWNDTIGSKVSSNLTRAGVTSEMASDPRVVAYFADRSVQQGPASIANHQARVKQAFEASDGNVETFLGEMSRIDKMHHATDFRTASQEGYTRAIGDARIDKRESLALRVNGAATATGGMPDKNATFARAADLTKGDPQLQHEVFTELGRRYHDFQTANQMEIQSIKIGMPQLIEAAKTGAYEGDMPIPEERIRALIPGVEGEKMIREFKFAQFEGGLMKEAQFATPEAIGEMERDVYEGTGSLSMRLQAHRGMATTGAGTSGADAEAESVDFAKERRALAGRFEAFKQQRQKLLTGPDADPAAYAAMNPEVKAASAAYSQAAQEAQGKPEGSPEAEKVKTVWNTYATQSMALQASLGIPEGERHLMTRGQSIDSVAQLSKPNADAKAIMDGMERHYGASWPTILKDMSTLGNMPPAYQALQVLDPQNAGQLSQFLQRNVHPKAPGEGKTVGPENGIAETMDQALTPKTARTIRDSIIGDSSIQKMLAAYDAAGGSLDFNTKLLQSMHFLAYAKALTGMDPTTAAGETIKAFTHNLEFLDGHGGAMVPAERIDDTRESIRQKMGGLTEENLAGPEIYQRLGVRSPFPDIGEHGRIGSPHLQDWVNRLKSNPRWVNNPDHSGVWLTDGGVIGGTGRIVRGKDGKPIEVKFADVPAPSIREEFMQPALP